MSNTNPRVEYLKACEKYQHKKHIKFMSKLDYYEVLLSLGYRKDEPIPDTPGIMEDAKPTPDPPTEKEPSLFD